MHPWSTLPPSVQKYEVNGLFGYFHRKDLQRKVIILTGQCETRFCCLGPKPGLIGIESHKHEGTRTKKFSVPSLGRGIYICLSHILQEYTNETHWRIK